MQWIVGKPNETGLWLIQTSSGDYDIWKISLDRHESDEHDPEDIELDRNGYGEEYFRFDDGDTSEPLDEYCCRFMPRRSFGPIPPDSIDPSTAIHSANIAECTPKTITKPRPFDPV